MVVPEDTRGVILPGSFARKLTEKQRREWARIKPWQHDAIQLKAAGMKQVEIAEKLNVHPNTLTLLFKKDVVQMALEDRRVTLRIAAEDAGRDALKEMIPMAIRKYEDILRAPLQDKDVPSKLQYDAARDLLEEFDLLKGEDKDMQSAPPQGLFVVNQVGTEEMRNVTTRVDGPAETSESTDVEG